MSEFLVRGGFITGPGLRFPVVIGRAGVAAHKREGDNATPAGRMALLRVLYRADRIAPPVCQVPVEPIGRQDGWCDDPDDEHYNQMVSLPHQARCERLWRQDGLYDIVGVLDWNTNPVVRGNGSAIFLHVAPPDGGPTAGCVALGRGDLLACLAAGLGGVRVEGGVRASGFFR